MFTLQNLNNSIFCKVQLAKEAFIENKNKKLQEYSYWSFGPMEKYERNEKLYTKSQKSQKSHADF